MQDGSPSFTAALVTLSRAAADLGGTRVHDFADPAAHAMLEGPFRLVDQALAGLGPAARAALKLASIVSRGALDVVALRTRAIDAALLAAVGRGVDRLVILGAGFDGRALRLPELAGVSVLEVDHPDTQAFKRARLASLLPGSQACRELVFVPVDFARDDLETSLRAAGLEAARPTFWIWEGVTMYLPRPVTAATLAIIRRLSAPGSELAVTHIDPATHAAGIWVTPLRWLVGQKAEPFVGHLHAHEMAELLAAAGFGAATHTSATDWARRFGDFPGYLSIPPWEHLAVAPVA